MKKKTLGRPRTKKTKDVVRNIYYPALVFKKFRKKIDKINKESGSNFSMNSRLIFLIIQDIKNNS